MPKVDFLLYAVHNAFWAAFGLTLLILRWMDRNRTADSETAPVAKQEQTAPGKTAPFSRALLAFHALAFALMYFGIGFAVVPGRVPRWFPGQRVVGTIVIAAGAALMVWALGSAIWVPSAIMWAAFMLMMMGSDLRARAEEKLLEQAFGARYREYCARTRRFVPGVY